jgi:cytochrome P450
MTIETTLNLPNPFGAEFARDPYGAYRSLLEAGPVHRFEVVPGLSVWLVCGYEQARDLLVDPRLSIEPASTTNDICAALLSLRTEEKQSLYGRHLLATDPPRHTQLRKVMSGALTARRLEAMAPEVFQIIDGLLDELASRSEADLLTNFALPLTIQVLAKLIGLPPDGVAVLQRLGELVLRGEAEHDHVFLDVVRTLGSYFSALAKVPETVSPNGLMRLLLTARQQGELAEEELNSLLLQLFFAGHESTSYFIVNALATLLHHRSLLEEIRRNPVVVDRTVEELLRFEGSVKSATWRFPTEDIEVAGTRVEAREPILIIFAAANRDPVRFDDPHTLDPTRGAAQGHLAFGHGPHHCLGNALGRLEARIAIRSLVLRFPDIKLAVPYEQLPWRQNMVMRGVRALPVSLNADATKS